MWFCLKTEEIPILYDDAVLAVCVKPAGVLSESPGMPERLAAQLGGEFFCVHRLDRDVGGVMVYARTAKAAAALSAAVAARRVEKTYLAVCCGRPEQSAGTLRDLLYHDRARNKTYVVQRQRRGVKETVLDYTVLAAAETEQGALTLLRIVLGTGRSHQIRVQFASRRLPLAGDAKYGSPVRSGGIALWSEALRFPDPETGETMAFKAKPKGGVWELFGV